MTDHDVLVFLLALATLLAAARLLGELARALRMPMVVGEMIAGILLGPSALGRVAPSAQRWLFPGGPPESMIGGYATVAVVLLLVIVGFEVDLGVLRRRGQSALATGLLGIVLPLISGAALGFLLPDSDLVDPSHRTTIALLLGVALSISALPVIAKTLLDLGLFKSDIGLLVMAAAMIDDLVGWLALSLLLGPVRGGAVDTASFVRTVVGGGIFAAGMLTLGKRFIDALLGRLARDAAAPGRVLSLIIVLALLGATATHAIGLHAVFGGFIVGLSIGRSARINARTRTAVEDFVTSVFAPVFFASIGLRVDFVGAFNAPLCLLVLVLAMVPKLVGCTLGSRIGRGPTGGRLGWRESLAVGFGMNARGAMGIILAAIARDAGVLKDEMFVALVVMALATSLMSGPAMKWLLYHEAPEEDVVTLLRRGAFVSELHARTPSDAIGELVRALGSLLAGRKRDARAAVVERELVAPTGLGDEVAIPHAAVEGLDKPLLALGRAPHGIDFDAPDGRPARVVFLLLIPPKAYEEEVRILASIARATYGERAREELAAASGIDEVTRVMQASAKRTRESMRPKTKTKRRSRQSEPPPGKGDAEEA
jgi:Kef-type K+ transport system membrane component KefB/mannitol/fructose-specific phosphotransferase system IIA component (Ntr-type)